MGTGFDSISAKISKANDETFRLLLLLLLPLAALRHQAAY